VQEQANFWGCEGFLPEKFLCDFCLQFFSHKDHENLFIVSPSIKKFFMCFFANVGRDCFKRQTTLDTIFARIFRDFVQIFRDFARIFDKSKFFGVRIHPLHPHLLHH